VATPLSSLYLISDTCRLPNPTCGNRPLSRQLSNSGQRDPVARPLQDTLEQPRGVNQVKDCEADPPDLSQRDMDSLDPEVYGPLSWASGKPRGQCELRGQSDPGWAEPSERPDLEGCLAGLAHGRTPTDKGTGDLARRIARFNVERMRKPIMDFSRLTVAERIQLAEDLWDSLPEAPEVLAVTEAQRAELDRRLAAHRTDPEAAVSWESLRQELLQG
jgi:putative addiction module component (TIGR02574 family)